jgi:hypothetical protein
MPEAANDRRFALLPQIEEAGLLFPPWFLIEIGASVSNREIRRIRLGLARGTKTQARQAWVRVLFAIAAGASYAE